MFFVEALMEIGYFLNSSSSAFVFHHIWKNMKKVFQKINIEVWEKKIGAWRWYGKIYSLTKIKLQNWFETWVVAEATHNLWLLINPYFGCKLAFLELLFIVSKHHGKWQTHVWRLKLAFGLSKRSTKHKLRSIPHCSFYKVNNNILMWTVE